MNGHAPHFEVEDFADPAAALARAHEIYDLAVDHLRRRSLEQAYLHALAQDVVGHVEGLGDGRVAVDDLEQAVVRDDDDRVDLLAKGVADISLADIVEAVEGPIALTLCTEGKGDCAVEAGCAVRPHWPVVNQALRGALASVSLIQFIASFALAFVIYLASFPEMLDSLTPGKFTEIITSMMLLLKPLKQLTTVNSDFQKGMAAAAEKEALQNQWAVTIAIVDDGGHLLWLQRLDGAAAIAGARAGRLALGLGVGLRGLEAQAHQFLAQRIAHAWIVLSSGAAAARHRDRRTAGRAAASNRPGRGPAVRWRARFPCGSRPARR